MLVLQFSLTLSHTESNALTLTVRYADASQIGIGTDLYVILICGKINRFLQRKPLTPRSSPL